MPTLGALGKVDFQKKIALKAHPNPAWLNPHAPSHARYPAPTPAAAAPTPAAAAPSPANRRHRRAPPSRPRAPAPSAGLARRRPRPAPAAPRGPAPLASAAQRWLAGAGRPFPAAAAVSLCPRCRLPPPRHLLPPRRTSVRTVFFLPRAVFLLLGVPPSVFFLLRAGSPNPSRFWIPFSSSLQVLDPLFLLPM